MADLISIQIPKTRWPEGSGFTATAYFRTRSTQAADTPDSVKYRVDCLTTGTVLTDWTTVTPAANVSISITSTENAIQYDQNRTERKQLTVESDVGLSNQHRGAVVWTVDNLKGTT